MKAGDLTQRVGLVSVSACLFAAGSVSVLSTCKQRCNDVIIHIAIQSVSQAVYQNQKSIDKLQLRQKMRICDMMFSWLFDALLTFHFRPVSYIHHIFLITLKCLPRFFYVSDVTVFICFGDLSSHLSKRGHVAST